MIRQLTYRQAINAFAFTALWFAIGGIALWSPIPGALGIAGPMFAAWLLLLFAILGVSGAILTAAAVNEAFPRDDDAASQPPARPKRTPPVPVDRAQAPIWAPPARPHATTGADAGTSVAQRDA